MLKWECINLEGLKADRERARNQFLSADPFRWCLLENFLLPGICSAIAANFEEVLVNRAGRRPGDKRHEDVARKLFSNDRSIFTPVQRRFFKEALSARFVDNLREITGIQDLWADEELVGSGLHEIYSGGFLNVHTDFNVHPSSGLHRKLNLIIYLNDAWQEEWGGHLELWPEDIDAKPVRVAPSGNRAVLFETSETSWHGHPEPLACPDEVTRKSMALYYYTTWPVGLEQRSQTRYRLTPSQQKELERLLRSAFDDLTDEADACERFSQYRPVHVRRTYRQLRSELRA